MYKRSIKWRIIKQIFLFASKHYVLLYTRESGLKLVPGLKQSGEHVAAYMHAHLSFPSSHILLVVIRLVTYRVTRPDGPVSDWPWRKNIKGPEYGTTWLSRVSIYLKISEGTVEDEK